MATKALVPYAFYTAPDLKATMNSDLLASADVTSDNPFTVTYKIKPEAVWNDGTPISPMTSS